MDPLGKVAQEISDDGEEEAINEVKINGYGIKWTKYMAEKKSTD